MDKHWDSNCTMSIVHFMAQPKTITGEAAIAESMAKIAADTFFGGIEITHIKDPAEREAMASFRAQSIVVAIGEAAGVTAAISVQEGVPMRKTDTGAVQSRLAATGGILT